MTKKVSCQSLNITEIGDVGDLMEFFKYSNDRIPLICAHRGGSTKDFPENAIATFENTLQQIPAFFEIDPRLTKDSIVIVMHDATLDRTTTGKGNVSDFTWNELKALKLKDPFGNITEHTIPRLDEVIQWAKGKTILILDKKDVPLKTILNKITRFNAESYILVSSYNPQEAAFYHKYNKNIMFEAFIKSVEQMKNYEETGIPWKNIVAYLGQPKEKKLYKLLHEKEVMTIIYTTPVLEKFQTLQERTDAYQAAIIQGGDILMSDHVIEVSKAIKHLIPKVSSKQKFFVKAKF